MTATPLKRAAFLALGLLLAYAVLVMPNHPNRVVWSALTRWQIEWPLLILLVLGFGKLRAFVPMLAAILLGIILFKLADYGTFVAYARAFNPISDMFFFEAGFGLMRDTLGLGLTLALIVGAVLGAALLYVLLVMGLRAWAQLNVKAPLRYIALIGALCIGSWTVADVGHNLKYWRFEENPPGTAWTSRWIWRRTLTYHKTATNLVAFRKLAALENVNPDPDTLDLLGGRDVLLIWVESYGRASFDNPRYSTTHDATRLRAQDTLTQAGLGMKSGWMTSPTTGGQSWLAHGALGSGLWTSDNGRYNAMIASGRKWLYHLAQGAGYKTTAIMPAITSGWPESAAMGFDQIVTAKDLPYKGARFNWATMPDQFTLGTYESVMTKDTRPNFIQIALISSHAPWTPLPEMVPWEALGDGTIFNEMASRGPEPKLLWRNRKKVPDFYRRALDYSLEATFSYLAQMGADAPLVMVIGDHQPAGFVAQSPSRDVAYHIIGPQEALAPFEAWDLSEGLFPAPNDPALPMDQFRDAFIATFSSSKQAKRQPHIAQARP